MSDSDVEIPIVIVNWKGIQDTLECMESVLQLTYPFYKVYLVDNHSNDGSVTILKEHFQSNPKVKLIFNQENLGFTKANNEVFNLILRKKKLPEYIALLNNDTAVDANWLSSLIETAKTQEASIVSSKMIDYYERNKMDNAGHLMLNTGEILPIGHGENIDLFNELFENMGACAGACLYSSEMLQRIGVFDEYFNTGYEDAELGVRAVMAGYKCIYDPSAVVYHKMGQSIKKVFNYQYATDIQKKILYTYLKLMPKANLVLNLPFVLVRYFAIIIVQALYRKPIYYKIITDSFKAIFFNQWGNIKKAREVNRVNIKLSFIDIQKKQTFFLVNNLKRFYHYFIQKKQSAFDTYGKKEII